MDLQLAQLVSGMVAHDDVSKAAELAGMDVAAARKALKRKEVSGLIDQLRDAVAIRHLESDATVIARLANWAEGNIVDYLDFAEGVRPGTVMLDRVKPKKLDELPVAMQKRIKKFKTTTSMNKEGMVVNFELELYDAMKATDALARIIMGDSSGNLSEEEMAARIVEFVREANNITGVRGGVFPDGED